VNWSVELAALDLIDGEEIFDWIEFTKMDYGWYEIDEVAIWDGCYRIDGLEIVVWGYLRMSLVG